MKNFITTLIVILSLNSLGFSQTDSNNYKLVIDFPLFDFPYLRYSAQTRAHYCPEFTSTGANFGDYLSSFANPSMSQSMAISKNYYSAGHYAINRLYRKINNNPVKSKRVIGFGLEQLSVALFDAFSPNSIFGNTWLHEEWHRASMAVDYTSSYNNVYKFEFLFNPSVGISVTQVSDEDLGRFKKRSPVNFVRLKSAGFEAETMLPVLMQNENFFYNLNLPNSISYLMINYSTFNYLRNALLIQDPVSTAEYDLTDSITGNRDFAGFDPHPWVYDLYFPEEAYEARGPHPSGVGIMRYIRETKLTTEQFDYLRKMKNRQLLNFLSPMNFFVRSIQINDQLRFNFGFQHYLTSFGDDTGIRFLLNYRNMNWFFAYHGYQNRNSYFPGIEVQLIDYPLTIRSSLVNVSVQTLIGIQPKSQSYYSDNGQLVGQAGFRVEYPLGKHFFPYLTFNGKTDGWIAGNPFTGSSVSVQIGFRNKFN